MQDHAADQLHIKMPHVQEAAACFADESERRHNYRLQSLLHQSAKSGFTSISVLQLFLHLRAQFREARLETFVAQRAHSSFLRVDLRDHRLQFFDVALVLGADKSSDDAVEYLCCFHGWVRRPLRTTSARAAFLPHLQTIYCNWWDAEEPRNSGEGSKAKSRAMRKSKSAPYGFRVRHPANPQACSTCHLG